MGELPVESHRFNRPLEIGSERRPTSVHRPKWVTLGSTSSVWTLEDAPAIGIAPLGRVPGLRPVSDDRGLSPDAGTGCSVSMETSFSSHRSGLSSSAYCGERTEEIEGPGNRGDAAEKKNRDVAGAGARG